MGLHVPVLERFRRGGAAVSPSTDVVGLVDPAEAGIGRAVHRLQCDPRRIGCATRLADLKGGDPDETIVQIRMPADDHAPAPRAATHVGLRRIIAGKPRAANAADVDEMQRIVDRTAPASP